jgi:hypothetical protein
MTPLTAPIQKSTKKRLSLTKVKRERGQSRTVIDTCEDPETKTAARLVRIETGGVDRKTGKPLRFFFEVTAKVPGAEEVTKTFKAERNARLVFLAAKHGVVDLGTRLAALPPKLWRAFRDAGAFSTLQAQAHETLWLMGKRPPCWPALKDLLPLHGAAQHLAILGLSPDGTRMNTGDSEADGGPGGGPLW